MLQFHKKELTQQQRDYLIRSHLDVIWDWQTKFDDFADFMLYVEQRRNSFRSYLMDLLIRKMREMELCILQKDITTAQELYKGIYDAKVNLLAGEFNVITLKSDKRTVSIAVPPFVDFDNFGYIIEIELCYALSHIWGQAQVSSYKEGEQTIYYLTDNPDEKFYRV